MTSVTALFNQKYKLNVICVFYFHFITSRPTTPPRELKLLTWRNWDPEEAAAATCASDCLIYCAPDTSYCLCILSLKAEIKNIESNHHSGKNRFKNDHNADLILSPAHPMHMWVIHLIGIHIRPKPMFTFYAIIGQFPYYSNVHPNYEYKLLLTIQ